MWLVSAVLALGGCLAFDPSGQAPGDAGQDAAPDSSPGVTAWRKTITITPPTLPGGAVQDFPVALLLAGDPDLAAGARDDGADIAFTASDGVTLLPHEIERYDGAAGRLVAWVRLPELGGQESTTIHLHYGQPDADDRQDPDATWSAGFRGVWHLAPGEASGVDLVYPDSSPNHNHGTATGIARPDEADGVAGPAADMTSNDIVHIGDPDDGSLDPGLASFSYSVWVRVVASAGNFDLPWYNGGFNTASVGYDFQLGTDEWTAGLADGASKVEAVLGQESSFLGQWVHLVAVIDRETSPPVLRGYVNGIQTSATSIQGIGALAPTIGARIGDSTNPFVGRVDEMRVYGHALTANRIALEYINLSQPEALYTVGSEEPAAYP